MRHEAAAAEAAAVSGVAHIYLLPFFVSDFLFKFLVIGSAGAGKSCLLHQFIESKCKFPPLSSGYYHRRRSECAVQC